MKLLVGLGNPGGAYARHRHNVGFMAVDAIADRHGFSPWKKKFSGFSCEGEIDGERVALLKPETFMNESGRAVGEAVRFLKIEIGDVIVFHDELDIDPGRLKVKTGGGNAGHNGLRSISQCVGNECVRVRIGIGHPGHKDAVSGYVLHDFAKTEREWLDPLLAAMADHATFLAAGKPDKFMAAVIRATDPADEPEPPKRAKIAPPDAAPLASKSLASKSRHPAGERATKQKTALEENLKKWLAGKK